MQVQMEQPVTGRWVYTLFTAWGGEPLLRQQYVYKEDENYCYAYVPLMPAGDRIDKGRVIETEAEAKAALIGAMRVYRKRLKAELRKAEAIIEGKRPVRVSDVGRCPANVVQPKRRAI